MLSSIDRSRTDTSRAGTGRTRPDTGNELPVIEFPDHDSGADVETVDHPYAVAERVLAASS